jgi:hypothetical protein
MAEPYDPGTGVSWARRVLPFHTVVLSATKGKRWSKGDPEPHFVTSLMAEPCPGLQAWWQNPENVELVQFMGKDNVPGP